MPHGSFDAREDYDSARATAYATLAIPIVLGAAGVGLATAWFAGTRETRVTIGLGTVSGRL